MRRIYLRYHKLRLEHNEVAETICAVWKIDDAFRIGCDRIPSFNQLVVKIARKKTFLRIYNAGYGKLCLVAGKLFPSDP